VAVELTQYRGPLGPVEPQLARRRIAVATDPAGRLCLVRPDSVVVEFGDGYRDVKAFVDDQGMDILGGAADEAPASGFFAARPRPSERAARTPPRWDVDQLHDLAGRFEDRGCTVHPNHVYLTDGVARQFRLLEDDRPSAAPSHALPVAAASTARPASPPAHLPAPLGLAGRDRPNVLVLDTGLRTRRARAEHEWLRDHCVVHDPWLDLATAGRWDDEDEPDDDGGGRLDVQAGHGTFISGVVRQQCPDAWIHHRGVLTSYGDGDDASVLAAIERAVAVPAARFDIVVMAFGTYATGGDPPTMARALRALLPGSLIVAAAGNDATGRPTFPAALPGVVAVGALDAGGRAAFSNFGPWVDACAPAVDVVSTFFTAFDDDCPDCGGLSQRYRGWARWSGTSFAAPKVAGVIAREMYLHGCTANEAWDRIRARAAFRLPDLGVVINA
jgi:subtilisin family serine protease